MILSSPTEVAFELFNVKIYFYGIILALAVFVGFCTAYQAYKNYYNQNCDVDKFFDFSPILIVIGLIGARLYFCSLNFSYYSNHPFEIFDFREGGLSIHGMIVFGLMALFFCAKYYHLNFWKILDCFLLGTPLAQAIGRWGNFFNNEAYGLPYEGVIKLFIPESIRPYEFKQFEYFHPTFLYESILNFIIFIILLILFKKMSKNPGLISAVYFILYGIVRLFIEQLRVDSALNINGIPIAQIASVFLIFTGIITILLKTKSHNIYSK